LLTISNTQMTECHGAGVDAQEGNFKHEMKCKFFHTVDPASVLNLTDHKPLKSHTFINKPLLTACNYGIELLYAS